jgi:hypothetical protein
MVMRSSYIRDENERYGIVEDLISPQDEVNKRRSKALHLMNTRTIVAEKSAVDNIERARAEAHKAAGYIEVRKGFRFEFVDHQQQIVDNLQLLQEAKGQFELIGPSGDVLDGSRMFELEVYRQMWLRGVQYWTEEDYVRVTDDPRSPQYIGINVPKTMADVLVERGADPAMLQQAVAQGQIDPAELEKVVRLDNELAELDVDIILDTGPDYKTIQEEQLANMMSLIGQVGQALPPKVLQTIVEIVIELSPLESRLKKRFFSALEPSQEEQQAAAKAQQYQEATAQLTIEKLAAEVAKIKAEAGLADARIDETDAKADKALAEAAQTAHEISNPPNPRQSTDR